MEEDFTFHEIFVELWRFGCTAVHVHGKKVASGCYFLVRFANQKKEQIKRVLILFFPFFSLFSLICFFFHSIQFAFSVHLSDATKWSYIQHWLVGSYNIFFLSFSLPASAPQFLDEFLIKINSVKYFPLPIFTQFPLNFE